MTDLFRRRLSVFALFALAGCALEPATPRPFAPGDRFRRVYVGRLDTPVGHLGPLLPVFRAALIEALARTAGVLEAREESGGRRPEDAVLLRGELVDDASPFVTVGLSSQLRTLAGRFELVDPNDAVLQRFVALQRYAPGSPPALGAKGLLDLAIAFAATVAAAVRRWLEGGPAALPADTRTRNGHAVTRVS